MLHSINESIKHFKLIFHSSGPYRGSYKIFCIKYIYIMIHISSKIAVPKKYFYGWVIKTSTVLKSCIRQFKNPCCRGIWSQKGKQSFIGKKYKEEGCIVSQKTWIISDIYTHCINTPMVSVSCLHFSSVFHFPSETSP